MTNCPHCFTVLDPDVRFYQCPGPCETFQDAEGSAYKGAEVVAFPTQKKTSEGERNWQPPPTIPCYKCGKPAHDICPTCHYVLPPDWRAGQAICVALAGARATGKSVYVGVVVKQLEQMLHRMGSLLSFATRESEQSYRTNYEAHLYAARDIMLSTTRVAETANPYQSTPMILSLGVIRGLHRYLVLRDVAGEDLANPAPDTRYLSYFQRAHAVLFMFDPSAVPSVRELLRGLIPEPLMAGGNPQTVLINLLKLIGEASPPIAMILSKFDTLQELRQHEDRTWSAIMANPGAAFQRDPGILEPRYDPVDAELLHWEVRSLLHILGAQAFVNAMVNPPRGRPHTHQFFAVSALGSSADGTQLHPHGIAPFRCLDPIRWVMAGQGIL